MKHIFSIAIFLILGFAGFCQEAVDLGLSVKWATCNVGANKPEKYGKYYTIKKTQKLSNSKWRVPTIEEIGELVRNCDYKWTTQNGVNGGLFTSKKMAIPYFFLLVAIAIRLCTMRVVTGFSGLRLPTPTEGAGYYICSSAIAVSAWRVATMASSLFVLFKM